MAVNIDFKLIAASLQAEIAVTVNTMKEKGARHFARPLLVSWVLLIASYRLGYLPPVAKLKLLDSRLAAARATAQYADIYKDLRDRLEKLYPQLPLLKDKDQWLLNSFIESLKAENIVSDSLNPPKETESLTKTLIYQSVDMSSNLKYSQIISWLTRIEGVMPILFVTSLDIAKRPKPIGENNFACTLGTIIPKTRQGL